MTETSTIGKDFIAVAHQKRYIKDFQGLRSELVKMLIHYEFDLPSEFNLIKLPDLLHKHRVLTGFSNTHNFRQELQNLNEQLVTFFNYDYEREKEIYNKVVKDTVTDRDPDIDKEPLISEVNSLQGSLTDEIARLEKEFLRSFSQNQKQTSEYLGSENSSIDTDKVQNDIEIPMQAPSLHDKDLSAVAESVIERRINPEVEIEETFNFSKSYQKTTNLPAQVDADKPIQDLDEAFEIIGIGKLKRGISKQIVTKKKEKFGLEFNEWVSENKLWVKLLLIASNNIESLDLATETKLLDHIQKDPFVLEENSTINEVMASQFAKIYKKLQLN